MKKSYANNTNFYIWCRLFLAGHRTLSRLAPKEASYVGGHDEFVMIQKQMYVQRDCPQQERRTKHITNVNAAAFITV